MDGLGCLGGIGLCAFSAFNVRGDGRRMALLKAYYDDSGEGGDPQHKACSLFGFISEPENWVRFETRWPAALDGLPFLHMKEFNRRNPPFDRLSDGDRARILNNCAQVVVDCGLAGLGSIVRLSDLRKFNEARGLQIDDYALNLYSSIVSIAHHFPEDTVEVVLDRASQRKMWKAIDLAEAYIQTDPVWKDRCDKISIQVLAKGLGFKDVTPIQAADYLAWEARRDTGEKDQWFDEYAGYKGTRDAHAHLVKWLGETGRADHGQSYIRPSLNALVDTGQVAAPVWDYSYLSLLDQAREGVWPKP